MEEMTKNQKAFLQVSEELLRIENSLKALEKIRILVGAVPAFTAGQMKDISPANIYLPDVQPLVGILNILAETKDGRNETLARLITATQQRQKLLKELTDTYLSGGDIVLSRLSKD